MKGDIRGRVLIKPFYRITEMEGLCTINKNRFTTPECLEEKIHLP